MNIRNWLKDNWFKVSIVIVCLVAIMTAFYTYKDYANKTISSSHKNDCFSIYKSEGSKKEVVRWRYEKDEDKCYITYRELVPNTAEWCKENLDASAAIYPPDGMPMSVYTDYGNCMDGTYEKSF